MDESNTSQNTVYNISSIDQLAAIAIDVLNKSSSKIFLFYGELGAGKTTFIKVLCKVLGVEELVSSPTYALINEYKSSTDTLYHMDLYRLKSVEEAYDIGIEDYLYSGNFCFIEWPQTIEGIIDSPFHVIELLENDDQTRQLMFK